MKKTDRRNFIKKSILAGSGIVLAGNTYKTFASNKTIGANDIVRVAVIGLNGHGRGNHIPEFKKISGVKIVALCDVDLAILNQTVLI